MLCGTTKEDYLNSLRDLGHEELVQRCHVAESRVALMEMLIRHLKAAVNEYTVRGAISLDYLGVATPEEFIHTTCEDLIKANVDDKV